MTLNTINQKKLKPTKNNSDEGMVNWENFQNNPWSIFPNYNNKLDNCIYTLSQIAYNYRTALYSYQSQEKRLQEKIQENSKEKLTIYGDNEKRDLFVFVLSIPIIFTLISGFQFFIKYDAETKFINTILFFTSLFLTLISLIWYHYSKKNAQQTQREKNNQEIEKKQNELNQILENLNSQYKHFYQETRTIVNNGEYIPIREHLDYYYQTNITELNLIVQEILETVYPKKEKALIDESLQPEKAYFLKTEHIQKIENYLTNVIDQKIKANILKKIDD